MEMENTTHILEDSEVSWYGVERLTFLIPLVIVYAANKIRKRICVTPKKLFAARGNIEEELLRTAPISFQFSRGLPTINKEPIILKKNKDYKYIEERIKLRKYKRTAMRWLKPLSNNISLAIISIELLMSPHWKHRTLRKNIKLNVREELRSFQF